MCWQLLSNVVEVVIHQMLRRRVRLAANGAKLVFVIDFLVLSPRESNLLMVEEIMKQIFILRETLLIYNTNRPFNNPFDIKNRDKLAPKLSIKVKSLSHLSHRFPNLPSLATHRGLSPHMLQTLSDILRSIFSFHR